MPRHAITTVGALITLAVLAACGGTASPSATATPANPGVQSATVSLTHMPFGQVTLAYEASSKTLTVQMYVYGLAPNSSHPAHIHTGSCEKQGPVLYPLNTLVADAHGDSAVVTAVQNVSGGIPNATWYINVHNGPGLSPAAQFEPIVCGDIANTNAGTFEVVKLANGPTPDPAFSSSPDQTATGTATLKIVSGALNVSIDITGLAPSSGHAVHIHQGTCAAQGNVVHALPNLVADATGHATLTTVVKGVSSIPTGVWYLNIHRATTIATGQTDFDPILCGNIAGGSGS